MTKLDKVRLILVLIAAGFICFALLVYASAMWISGAVVRGFSKMAMWFGIPSWTVWVISIVCILVCWGYYWVFYIQPTYFDKGGK